MNKVLDIIDLTIYAIIAFLIPLYTRAIPVFMILLILSVFLRKTTYLNLSQLFKSYKFYILISPFILMLIGYFYSLNKDLAFKTIETGSAIIIFPFVFFFFKDNVYKEKFHLVFKAFVIGTVLTYAILWINIIPQYLETKDNYLLFYSSFCQMIKTPNHLSYDVLFAVIIMFLNLLGIDRIFLSNKSKWARFLVFLGFLVLSVFLFQLAAKSTILIYIVTFIWIIIYAFIKKIIKIKSLISIMVVIIGLAVFMISIPRVKARFTNMFLVINHNQEIDYTKSESSTLRFSAIKSSLEVIQRNWLIGVGTGDVMDELERNYARNNYTAAGREHTNPHNQFLRAFVMLGIFGFVSVCLIFFLLIKDGFKKKSLLMILWSFSMVFVFIIDDVFIFRDGVILFTFFTSYFIFCQPELKYFSNLKPTLKADRLINNK
jgi:O-antigen ligase